MAITKVRASGINLSGNTSYLNMPKGTTAQRPSSPITGMIRENTTLNKIEVYNGTEWRALKENVPGVEYLVLAGGGGGGGWGGGGGAGGLLISKFVPVSGTAYTVAVGTGGARATNNSYNSGSNGNISSISGSGLTTIEAAGGGGGGGGTAQTSGNNGGSGGGAANAQYAPAVSGGIATPAGQGNNGGASSGINQYRGGGGGGGAGSAGSQGNSNVSGTGGYGGDGLQSNITGNNKYYAGGGGGHTDGRSGYGNASGVALGGSGIGGNGGNYQYNNAGTDGIRGSGGGGAYNYYGYDAGNGGDGTVIIKVPNSFTISVTGSPTLNPDGAVSGFKIYEFGTGGGTFTIS